MLTVSLHNHTTWSDGQQDMETMIRAAQDAGIKTFGISDHWLVRPDGTSENWSMPYSRLNDYVETLLRFRQQFQTDNFKLLIGLEVDFFAENAHEVREYLRQFPLDYTIGSIHFVGSFPVDNTRADWLKLDGQAAWDDIYHGYWRKMRQLCQSGLYDIVGHFDLPKKFAIYPSYDPSDEIELALEALRASGMKLELNTSGWDKDCQDAYPAQKLVDRARQLGIPFVISADAHHASHLSRFRQQALERLHLTTP